MSREKLLHIAIGAIIALTILVPVGVYAFVKSGIYDTGASSPHTKLTEWITHETMIHSVRSQAKGIEAPRSASAAEVVNGFCLYETRCVACHGAAAVARQQWVNGIEPQPPYLLDARQQWKPRELFWIVKNGIKMTAMPSWRDSLSDREIWDVIAWLAASSKLPPQTYLRWRAAKLCPSIPSPFPGSSATPHPSRARRTGGTDG